MHDAPDIGSASSAAPPLRHEPDDVAVVSGFFARLKRLPLASWMRATLPLADGAAEDDFESPGTAAARTRLRAVIDGKPAALNLARARVDDVVAIVEGFAPPVAVKRMKRVALTAVLALIAREHLSHDDFVRLYRPFASSIPADEVTLRTS